MVKNTVAVLPIIDGKDLKKQKHRIHMKQKIKIRCCYGVTFSVAYTTGSAIPRSQSLPVRRKKLEARTGFGSWQEASRGKNPEVLRL